MKDVKPLVVFDELHKFRLWKAYLKGAFDDAHTDFSFLVTGSGRLDLYRKGGDSLAGRSRPSVASRSPSIPARSRIIAVGPKPIAIK